MRDNYWFVTFELPYILCKYGTSGSIAKVSGQTQPVGHVSAQQGLLGQNAPATRFVPDGSSPDFIQALEMLRTQLQNMSTKPAPISAARKEGEMMKYSIAFNNRIDPKNIVELSDEWIYREPEFFTFKCDLSYEAILEYCNERRDGLQEKALLKALKSESVTPSNEEVPNNGSAPENDRAPKEAEALSNEEPSRNVPKDKVEALKNILATEGRLKGFVTDIPKLKHFSKKGPTVVTIGLKTNEILHEHLSNKPRTIADSKKRFLQLFN